MNTNKLSYIVLLLTLLCFILTGCASTPDRLGLQAFYKKGSTDYRPTIPKESIPPDTPPKVKAQIERFYSSDPSERAAAALILGEMDREAETAIPFLVDLLDDNQSFKDANMDKPESYLKGVIRTAGEEAAWTLGKIGEAAVMPLIAALENPNAFSRANAISAMGMIDDERTIVPLIEMFQDENNTVRTFAEDALAKKGEAATFSLLGSLEAKDPETRGSAATTLGMIRDPLTVSSLVEILKDNNAEVRRRVALSLREIIRPVIEPVIMALEDESEHIRYGAAFALMGLGEERIEGVHMEAALDRGGDLFFRKHSIEELVKLKTPATAALIVSLTKDKDPELRATAVRALGKTSSPGIVTPLVDCLRDESAQVRSAAAWTLGKVKAFEAIDPLIAALGDESVDVRENAAGALGKIGDEKAVTPLANTLNDKSLEVKAEAVEALGKIGNERAVDPLIAIMKALEVDEQRAELLLGIGFGETFDEEREMDSLLELDQMFRIHLKAAEALGEIEGAYATETILGALKDESRFVRALAIVALVEGERRDPRVFAEIAGALQNDSWYLVRVFAALAMAELKTPQALSLLIIALNDENSGVRRATADTLGNLKASVAVDPLIDLLKDPKPEVRQEAAESLEEITGQDYGQDYELWRKLKQ